MKKSGGAVLTLLPAKKLELRSRVLYRVARPLFLFVGYKDEKYTSGTVQSLLYS